jgi:predicted  nucleic acid-binding Zn-ribbon protein
MATLADVLKAIRELITVTEKVRENTDRIAKLEEKVNDGFKNVTEEMHGLKVEMGGLKDEFRAFREETRLGNSELKGDIKAILVQLKTEERIDALESLVREHIDICDKAKA